MEPEEELYCTNLAEGSRSQSDSPTSATQLSSNASAVSLGEAIAKRARQGIETWSLLSGEEKRNFTAASADNMRATQASTRTTVDDAKKTSLSVTHEDFSLPPLGGTSYSFQLEFQDSRLSPSLPLLPANSGKPHSLVEDSTLHQTDLEFHALKASPDTSSASIRFAATLHDGDRGSRGFPEVAEGSLSCDQASLSQHPLAHTKTLAGDFSSCCSLSQHSMSPTPCAGDDDTDSPQTEVDRLELQSGAQGRCATYGEKEGLSQEPQTVYSSEDSSTSSRDVSVHLLEDHLHKDTGTLGSISSDNASVSGRSMTPKQSSICKAKETFSQSQEDNVLGQEPTVVEPDNFRSTADLVYSVAYRECPVGATSLSRQRHTEPEEETVRNELSNVTIRSSHAQQEDNSNELLKQFCHETDRALPGIKNEEIQSHPQLRSSHSSSPNAESVEAYSGRQSTVVEAPADNTKAESRWSAGFSFEQGHMLRELSSSGIQMGVDGSFAGSFSQPVSQSTPAVLEQLKAKVLPCSGKLSLVESNLEASLATAQTKSISSKQLVAPIFDVTGSCTMDDKLTSTSVQTSGKIQALPSVSYMEKVGAWNANLTSGKTYFDDLALRRFSGVSTKKKAFDAVSDPFDCMLGSVRSPPRLSVSTGSHRRNLAASFSSSTSSDSQKPSIDLGGRDSLCFPIGRSQSSNAPAEDVQARGAQQSEPSASSDSGRMLTGPGPPDPKPARDQSLSALAILGSSERHTAKLAYGQGQLETAHAQDAVEPNLQEPESDISKENNGVETKNTPFLGLSRFSDVSSDQDLVNSQEVSLDMDHYSPYLAAGPASIKEKEMNINERIPMYLHNLGIDQSPSTILTPVVQRGPIREPEFSLTDLHTVKSSTGAHTKSTRPSEGTTSEKGDFSRYSHRSLDSSMSLSLSTDSLHPKEAHVHLTGDLHSFKASLNTLAQPRSETGTLRKGQLPASETSQPPNEHSPTTLHVLEPIEKFQSNKALSSQGRDTDQPLVSLPEASRSEAFVGLKTLQKIRKLLGRADSTPSNRSSTSSAASLWCSQNSLCVQSKQESFQRSLASSPGNNDNGSLLWDKSSSGSLLTSDGLREMTSSDAVKSPRPAGHQLTAQSTQNADPVSTGSVRREPEGCSAAAPDQAPPPLVSTAAVDAPETAEVSHNQEVALASGRPANSSVEKSVQLNGESDGGGSADSLAARVAALLRNDSSATVTSSTASTEDEEERRAREWAKLKLSGQQCEMVDLNLQDRRRVEEIKKELLLGAKCQAMSQLSSDTDSSAHSSQALFWKRPPGQAGHFVALKAAENHLAHHVQRLSRQSCDFPIQSTSASKGDVGVQVQEFSPHKGLFICGPADPPIASVTISSRCRPPPSPTPPPLHLAHLATDAVACLTTRGDLSQSQALAGIERVNVLSKGPLDTELVAQASCVSQNQHMRSGSSSTDHIGFKGQDQTGLPSKTEMQSTLFTLGTQDSFYTDLSLPSREKDVGRRDTALSEIEMGPHGSRTFIPVSQLPGRSLAPSFCMSHATYRQMSRSLPEVGSAASLQESHQAPPHALPFSGSSSTSPSTKVMSHLHFTVTPKQSSVTSLVKSVDGSASVNERQASQRSDSSIRASSQDLPDLSAELSLRSGFSDTQQPAGQRVISGKCVSASEPSPLDPGLLSHEPQADLQPVRRQDGESSDVSTQVNMFMSKEQPWSAKTSSSFPLTSTTADKPDKPAVLSAPPSEQTSVSPVLLPYKPSGSPELFYVPQREPLLSPIPSDTTMESSHPGSNDALPPQFSTEVLGSRDQEAEHSITTRHSEGIYSKRRKHSETQAGAGMQGSNMNGDEAFPTKDGYQCFQQSPCSLEVRTQSQFSRGYATENKPPSFTSFIPKSANAHSKRNGLPDREPSRGHWSFKQATSEEFAPLQQETSSNLDKVQLLCGQGGDVVGREGSVIAKQGLGAGHGASQETNSGLDKVWQTPSQRRNWERAKPTSETERSLLERLERLSRLIHNTSIELERANHGYSMREGDEPAGPRGGAEAEPVWLRERQKMEPVRQRGTMGVEPSVPKKAWSSRLGTDVTGVKSDPEGMNLRRDVREDQGKGVRRIGEEGEHSRHTQAREMNSQIRTSREQPIQQAWGEESQRNSTPRSTLHPSVSQHHCPAERDDSKSRSGETDAAIQTESGDASGTASTINTTRLIQAFGREHVDVNLENLHTAVDRQRETKDRRGRRRPNSRFTAPAPTRNSSTDDSTVTPETGSSTSSCYHPPHRGLGLLGKRNVKLVSKGVQAGDLEIVTNGTRKHTRDVGTTFPSPRLTRTTVLTQDSAPDSGGGSRIEQRIHLNPQVHPSERRGRRSQPVRYPQGVSWFVPADDLKAKSRKENVPDDISATRPGLVWFEPYTKFKPWREPLRERQVQEEPMISKGWNHDHPISNMEPSSTETSNKVPSSLVRVTLQEALELRRPDFISRSRERMKRLGLQAQERRMQSVFARDREDLFNRPGSLHSQFQRGPPAYAKRAVPKKEMFMRSKRMYSQLPEVRRKEEEERRKAEYHSYRLKAQLYKTKITNRILGRRTPWQ